jgi:hypothetical protein
MVFLTVALQSVFHYIRLIMDGVVIWKIAARIQLPIHIKWLLLSSKLLSQQKFN